MLKADQVLDWMEGEVGTVETGGANDGPRVRFYQAVFKPPPLPLGSPAYAWCNAFAARAQEQGGCDSWIRYETASTFLTYDRAKKQGLIIPAGKARPGAQLVWPGVHIETLHTRVNGSVWRCIGGNVSDGVRWTTRDVTRPHAGTMPALILAPEIAAQPVTEDNRPRWWLHDPGATDPDNEWRGPWLSLDRARRAQELLEAHYGRKMGRYRTSGKLHPTFPTEATDLGKTR